MLFYLCPNFSALSKDPKKGALRGCDSLKSTEKPALDTCSGYGQRPLKISLSIKSALVVRPILPKNQPKNLSSKPLGAYMRCCAPSASSTSNCERSPMRSHDIMMRILTAERLFIGRQKTYSDRIDCALSALPCE